MRLAWKSCGGRQQRSEYFDPDQRQNDRRSLALVANLFIRRMMFDECREMWVIHIASRCGVDLEQQVLLGSMQAPDLQAAAQKCWACPHFVRCENLLDASTPLLKVPSYCANADFLRQIEKMNMMFWCGVELTTSDQPEDFSDNYLENRIFGVDTCIELDGESLRVESWAYLEKQVRSWEWRFTCEEWLLENAESSRFVAPSDWTSSNLPSAVGNLSAILQHTELGLWLVRSVASAMGISLKDASENGIFSQKQYADMVLECCLCPLRDQCQNWLDETKAPAETPLPGCANAEAFDRLLSISAPAEQ